MSRKEGGLPRISLHYLELDYLSCHSSSHPPHGTHFPALWRPVGGLPHPECSEWLRHTPGLGLYSHSLCKSTKEALPTRLCPLLLEELWSLLSKFPLSVPRSFPCPPPLSVCLSICLCSFCCSAAQVYHLFFSSFLSSISLSS